MHALVFRTWGDRLKGRDWFDFEWYVRNDYPLNFVHLRERIKQFNGVDMSKDEFQEKLIERLSSADIANVKQDVYPFVTDPKVMDIWSNDYFIQLAGMIKYE